MRIGLLAALATLTAPAAATAASRVVETGLRTRTVASFSNIVPTSLAGPFLSGDEVIWIERRREGDSNVLLTLAEGPAGRRQVDRRADMPWWLSADAGDGRIAVARLQSACPADDEACRRYMHDAPVASEVQAGALTQPLTTLAGTCLAVNAQTASGAVLLGCYPSGHQLIEADGTSRRLAAVATPLVRIAGDLIARREGGASGGWLVVRRRATDEEVLRVPQPEPNGFDLALEAPSVRIDGGRIALLDWVDAARRFIVLERDGRVVADQVAPPAGGDWDFDGDRIAFAQQPCSRIFLTVWEVSSPLPAGRGGACRQPRLDTARVRLEGERITVPFACQDGVDAECNGSVWSRLQVRRGRRVSRTYFRPKGFDQDAGDRWTISLLVPRRQLARLRAVRSARLTLEVTVGRYEPTRRRFEIRLAGRPAA